MLTRAQKDVQRTRCEKCWKDVTNELPPRNKLIWVNEEDFSVSRNGGIPTRMVCWDCVRG